MWEKIYEMSCVRGLMRECDAQPCKCSTDGLSLKPDGTAINPIALIRHLQGDPNIMKQLQETNRELFQAISSNNVEMLQNLLRQQHQQKISMQQRRQQEIVSFF